MNRREFLLSSGALMSMPIISGCVSAANKSSSGRMLFGACRGGSAVKLMASIGYDFFEAGVWEMLNPDKDEEWWKKQRDMIQSQPIPLRSCIGFIPGRYRLTGPNANHAPALDYAEKALRRAEEVGVKTVVFGSGGARNVPGDFSGERKNFPNLEKGAAQFTDFCRELSKRVEDLKNVCVVVEPLRPNESNIINYVWQGEQVCKDVGSPRVQLLADMFHMMMGGESAESIVKAGSLIKHCHIASYITREFPGSDPATVDRLRPYFDALRKIGYTGGISCETGWGKANDFAKNLETALNVMRSL